MKTKNNPEYKGITIASHNIRAIEDLLHDRAVNMVNYHFADFRKKVIKECELINCQNPNKELKTCHVHKEVTDIIIDILERSKKEQGYNVFEILEEFIIEHKKNGYPENIRFLCGKHHTELDNIKRNNPEFVPDFLKKLKPSQTDSWANLRLKI